MMRQPTEKIQRTIARLEKEGKTEQADALRRVLAQREPGYVRKFKVRPVGGEEIANYRLYQDAYYPTLFLMEELQTETGNVYEMVTIAKGRMVGSKYVPCAPYENVPLRSDEIK